MLLHAIEGFVTTQKMNDQPPPLQAQPVPPAVPKSGAGCFAKGCLALIVALVLIVVIGGAGTWWLYGKAIGSFTADRAAKIALEEPSPAALQQARTQLQQLQDGVRNRKEAIIEFSAADLNSLIASETTFAGLRGRVRVEMAEDDMILDLSAPLDSVRLPRFKGRWFNGRTQFRFNYDGADFIFTVKSIEANGHKIESDGTPGFNSAFLETGSSSFSRSFNDSFHKGQQSTAEAREFWDRIKSMSVRNGNLVVETKG